ncbi:MAG: glycoside hydrolase family 9 protein [Ignavibacteriaceae bacterium]
MYKQFLIVFSIVLITVSEFSGQELKINNSGYFETQGLNVIVHNDIYPEGHQGGITIIQHGVRVAANGDVSIQPTPGQWEPFPHFLNKEVMQDEGRIVVRLKYPDSTRILTDEQPVIYPDFEFYYKLNVVAEGNAFRIIVDLEKPLPKEWVGKVGLNLELFPGDLFGRTYSLGSKSGIFPRYANTTVKMDSDGEYEAVPFAEGPELVVAPEDPYRTIIISTMSGTIQLLDGRVKHNNGWFVVRSLIPEGVTNNAVEWLIKPNIVDGWKYGPVIHTSQVGYHTKQPKKAIIELDKTDTSKEEVNIIKILPKGGFSTAISIRPVEEKDFLRFRYLSADFSSIEEPGMYIVQYGEKKSEPFKVGTDTYQNGVWQPTLEYFLPVQMCHMKIFEKHRVWHNFCHLDDARLAPENINHFDTYVHGKLPDGLTPLTHVKGLNKGGWHDAGDYDFRIESQIGTILTLVYAFEEFDLKHDQTLISQEENVVEIHHPDGKPDVLQQIEHGVLTVLGGYNQFGKLYRGILCPTLRQYDLLGDAGNMTDNKVYEGKLPQKYEGFWYDHITIQYDKYYTPQKNRETPKEFIKDFDDRFVFLEDNPGRQIYGVSGLAAASRALKEYNDSLSAECIKAAEDLWNKFSGAEGRWIENQKIEALVELILTTGKEEYKDMLIKKLPDIVKNINSTGWIVGRVMPVIKNEEFISTVNKEILKVKERVDEASKENPFGIPYHPQIWGAGWGIQEFGLQHYFLYKAWPGIFTVDPMLNALNFVLGCHPGESTASFVSGVGANSQIVAYGANRAEWSFIPGGVVSGTNLVRPDLPELKVWPFLWQQAEYVIGGGAENFMFLALAADKILNDK